MKDKEFELELELYRVLEELEELTGKSYNPPNSGSETDSNKIKNYCRKLIRIGDKNLDKRIEYAMYHSKKGKLRNLGIQGRRKLNQIQQQLY